MANRDFSRTISHGHNSGFGRSSEWFAKIHIDLPLLLLLLTIAAAGLLILYSGSGRHIDMVERQAVHFGLGFIALFVTAQLPPRFYRSIAPWAYVGGVIALLAVIFFGIEAKGAQRWIEVPGLPRFQPSEIMKLALPLMMAWYMSSRSVPPKYSDIFKGCLIILLPVILILKQPDLGTAILIFTAGALVIFFAGMSWKLILTAAGLIAAFTPIMWLFVMREYQKQRVLTFLNPESDPLGSGWNIIQSKTAIGSGGIEGKGWLMGTQSQLEFLPESHTDFIIAVLAEELGLIGVLLLLTLYFVIIMRCLYLSSRSETLFGKLLSGSLSVTFFIYLFVNIGMVSGILPVVGVPLPLISYGGTSVISLLTAFGVLMSMSTHNKH